MKDNLKNLSKEKYANTKHTWHFIQTGGLTQLKITSIDDVLSLDTLDPKLWIALTCPVKGLEFDEETLSLLDTDHNGRVRIPEILGAVSYIKTYFKTPEVIMTKGESIPLSALGEVAFECGSNPLESAKAILSILKKPTSKEICLQDVCESDKLFSPSVINGDGVLPPDACEDDFSKGVINDIIACTGGADDISGAKGITRAELETFFSDIKALKSWRESSGENAEKIYFLKFKTEEAAASYLKVKDKIDDYFLRCSLDSYNNDVFSYLRKQEEEALSSGSGVLPLEQMQKLPIALPSKDKLLNLSSSINPAYMGDIDSFVSNVAYPILGEGQKTLSEEEWLKIKDAFNSYITWYSAKPSNSATSLSFERIDAILASDAENIIASYLNKEDKCPPVALASKDLKKMLLLRRDFVELLRNFVSFEDFYSTDKWAIFQCGTLYIDGRSCELCFKVTDSAKHATMSPLSQCYLLYCTCKRPSTNETMEIAAMVSAGSRDNLIVGRNGLFYDRDGKDWDATVTKIVENPISIREAFWSPYKKMLRMIQERVAKTASDAENSVSAKMTSAVENPKDAATEAKTNVSARKFDVGTIAAISVAFTGIATVVGGLLQAFFGLGWWIPVGLIGIILIISLPSMFIAYLKLRQRNIAPILDASGWAVNGNVKINIPLGALLTATAVRPKGSKLDANDPFKQKSFPVKRCILLLILLALIVIAFVIVAKNNWSFPNAWNSVKAFFTGLFKTSTAVPPAVETTAIVE